MRVETHTLQPGEKKLVVTGGTGESIYLSRQECFGDIDIDKDSQRYVADQHFPPLAEGEEIYAYNPFYEEVAVHVLFYKEEA